MWRLRRGLWDRLLTLKFRLARPRRVPLPSRLTRPIRDVPFTDAFPRIPIAGIVVADYVPKDERKRLALWFCTLQSWLNQHFPPMQPGLRPIDPNPAVALGKAYSQAKRRCFTAPGRPAQYGRPPDLGGLAVASPYACYLHSDGRGGFQWDLRSLEVIECHPGLRSPAAFVQFAMDQTSGRLNATRIESELGVSVPGDSDWHQAQRLALCAVSNHLSLVRHFNWIHLVSGGPLGYVTRNCLPIDHPIRRLLQPHVFATQSSNQMVTLVQMAPGGDFENTFSFTHGGMCKLFEATSDEFDLEDIEPTRGGLRRGLAVEGLHTPALDNHKALMAVIRTHVDRYLGLYFDSDDAMAEDACMALWVDALARRIPNGVRQLAGEPITIAGAALLISTLIYLTTVEHEIVGSGAWDYQLWDDVQPARIYENGQRPPLDVYQRLVNANFNLNVHRTPLMSDFSYLGLDPAGRVAFQKFLCDLVDLQGVMDRESAGSWRIEPRCLKANINA